MRQTWLATGYVAVHMIPSLVDSGLGAARRCARRTLAAALVAGACVPATSSPLEAQSLRGSRASIDRMHRRARAERLPFLETAASVRRAVARGRLLPLAVDSAVRLHAVSHPYVHPAVRTFVGRLGVQYHAACGEPLVVTSATRPATRQPPNASARTVHPTGMAVDLRRPAARDCLAWLRRTLLDLERAGLLEATEERAPAHFHVAVFPSPYARYAAAREARERRTRAGVAPPTYVVRPGDTLWGIARANDATPGAITRLNGLDGDTIRPGQTLRLPVGDR